MFGNSISLSSDGQIVALGTSKRDYHSLTNNGLVHVYNCSSTKKNWLWMTHLLGGTSTHDDFGGSVSVSSDDMTVAAGGYQYHNSGNGYVHVYVHNPTTDGWDQLGSTIVGVAKGDLFGLSVPLSEDGRTIAVGAPRNGDNGGEFGSSGHVRMFKYSSATRTWD